MCPLCSSEEAKEIRVSDVLYHHCTTCDLRYLDPAQRLDEKTEFERYHLHEPGDDGYRRFVTPLLEALRERVPSGARGLDFGAGRYPVLGGYMRDMGFDVRLYDPFFWPAPVEGPFDFIVACEVVEHLYQPSVEFERLRDWLVPGGWLTIMTDLVTPATNFVNWYYRRDPTHVSFYSDATFRWIARRYGFEAPFVDGRVVGLRRTLEKPAPRD